MKHFLFFVALMFSTYVMNAQKIFKVVEINRTELFTEKGKADTGMFFRIICEDGKETTSISYPFIFPQAIDTLKAVCDLLNFEGDKRICVFPINNYNPARSQIYMGKSRNYSIQVEALFMINQLIYDKPFIYSSYPLLVDKRSKKTYSIDGIGISKAYQAYRQWYAKMSKLGIKYIKEKNIMPLDNSTIEWY